MVRVKDSGGTTLETFSYDARNHRVTNTVGTTTTNLYYSNQWQVLEEQVSGADVNRYVWSPVYVNAMVLRDRDSDSNGTLDERLWPTEDANWDVMALVNPSGVAWERYTYDPYGVQTVYDASYTVRSGGSAYIATHGFQGMQYDSISGLNEADERWYNSSLHVWTSVDPIYYSAGDLNLYRTIGNQPTNTTDPSGLVWPFSAIVGGGVGAIVGGGSQLVSNLWYDRPTFQGVGGAMVGGAVTGDIVGTVGPAGFATTMFTGAGASAAGAASSSVVNQLYQSGTLNGQIVLHDAVVGAMAGGVGGGAGSLIAGRIGVSAASPMFPQIGGNFSSFGRIGGGAIAGGGGGIAGGASAGAFGALLNGQDPITGALNGGSFGGLGGAFGGGLSGASPIRTFMNSQQETAYNLAIGNRASVGATSALVGPQGQSVLAYSVSAGWQKYPLFGRPPLKTSVQSDWLNQSPSGPHPRITCGEPSAISMYLDTHGSPIGATIMTVGPSGQIYLACPSCRGALPIYGVSDGGAFPPYIWPIIVQPQDN